MADNWTDTAEGWEGFQAFATRQPCKYDLDKSEQRALWADGYATAVRESKVAKPWWKSSTFQTAIVCLIAGFVVIILGRFAAGGNGGSKMMMDVGGGISIGSILAMGVRAMLRTDPVSFGGYNVPMNNN